MARITPRRTIARGIVRDTNCLLATVRIGSWRHGTEAAESRQYPFGTPLTEMVAWQHETRAKLLRKAPTPIDRRSLAADIVTFIDSLPEGRYRIDTEDLLGHWSTSAVAAMPRDQVTRVELLEVRSGWVNAGASESSCNRRLSRLRKLYRAFDGLAPNPTDAIPYLSEPKPEPRDVPARIVKLILDSIPDQGRARRGEDRPTYSETKIRLRVQAWTGAAPATIARIGPRDLDLAHARVFLRWRRKGKGSKGAWLTLLAPAVEALREFVAAGLLEKTWSNSSAGKSWRGGIARATEAAERVARETGDRSWLEELARLPPDCRPYDLRHAYASEIYRQTGDIGAVAELLQHASFNTTARYTRGAVSARVAAAITTAGAAYAALETLPAPVEHPTDLHVVKPA